jgi:outer membrane protein assembly factor BamB
MNKSGKRKWIFFILLALITVFSLLAPAAVLADEGEWPQFHNDAANTGYTTSEAPDTDDLAWESADIGAVAASSVAVANGKIFVNCGDALTCLDESTGVTLWSEPITASSVTGSWSSPVYHDGRVFISGADVYCFSENGGPVIWTYDLPQDSCNGGPMVANGMVVAGDWDGGNYHFIDELYGNNIRTFPVVGYAQGTPAYDSGRFYLTSWESVGGNVYCVDADTGEEIWHTRWDHYDEEPMDWDTCGSPCVADGRVFITTYYFYGYGELLALNATDGNLEWGPVEIERTDSTPAYADGKVYVCGGCYGFSDEGERTYCFEAATGNPVWETPVGTEPGALDVGNWTCSVAVADGKVFVGKPNHGENPMDFDYQAIYALDAATGSEIWHYDNGGASPAVADGFVFTIGEGKVWAFGEVTYPDWDVNEDGNINIADVGLVGMHWGETGDEGWIREDVNNDGSINIADVGIIGMHWGE